MFLGETYEVLCVEELKDYSLPSAPSAEDGGTRHCELRLPGGSSIGSRIGESVPVISGTEHFIPIVYTLEKLSCHVIDMVFSF